jgi:hypothetical protein
MNPNWAEENLQTIRTLMERSAVYRRALAPIMLMAGVVGLAGAATTLFLRVEEPRLFAGIWFALANVVLVAALLLARRQAIKSQEPFWSPPTRRVVQALVPPLFCGLFLSAVFGWLSTSITLDFFMVIVWLLFYGCALHAAGAFMTRSVRWFGWAFIGGATFSTLTMLVTHAPCTPDAASLTMGFFFGILHLAFGVYLYFTEKKNPVA